MSISAAKSNTNEVWRLLLTLLARVCPSLCVNTNPQHTSSHIQHGRVAMPPCCSPAVWHRYV